MTKTTKEHFFYALANLEGFRSKPYLCPAGLRTIGYGHLCPDTNINSITLSEARQLLKDDFLNCINAFATLNIPLEEHEVYALGSLIFNIGINAFKRSSFPALLRTYSSALDKRNFSYAETMRVKCANHFLAFIYYHDRNGVKHISEGLKSRRQFERDVFLGKFV